MHACDRQTDRRTEFSSLDRVCIACSAVKIGSHLYQLSSRYSMHSSLYSSAWISPRANRCGILFTNVYLRSPSLCRRPSVCRLTSVCRLSRSCALLSRLNFRQCLYAIWYRGHLSTATEKITEIVPGNPSVGGEAVKRKMGSQI